MRKHVARWVRLACRHPESWFHAVPTCAGSLCHSHQSQTHREARNRMAMRSAALPLSELKSGGHSLHLHGDTFPAPCCSDRSHPKALHCLPLSRRRIGSGVSFFCHSLLAERWQCSVETLCLVSPPPPERPLFSCLRAFYSGCSISCKSPLAFSTSNHHMACKPPPLGSQVLQACLLLRAEPGPDSPPSPALFSTGLDITDYTCGK